MNPPDKRFTLRDERRNINYVVLAYREITRAELLQAVRVFRSSAQGRKVKPGHEYTIITTIGASE